MTTFLFINNTKTDKQIKQIYIFLKEMFLSPGHDWVVMINLGFFF